FAARCVPDCRQSGMQDQRRRVSGPTSKRARRTRFPSPNEQGHAHAWPCLEARRRAARTAARTPYLLPGTWPSTPLTKNLVPPRNASSAVVPALTCSLPSLDTIGPFQIANEPSFRPALTLSTLALRSA